MDRTKLSEIAADLGLERAYQIDPDAFEAALKAARSLVLRVKGPDGIADEPAHVFAPSNAPDGADDCAGDRA